MRFGRWSWFRGFAAAVLLAALLVLVGRAQAAFPGRNGLLAVQPLKGSGIVLVTADGRGETRVCLGPQPGTGALSCSLARPEWSPDGRAIALEGALNYPQEVSVMYTDGSCVDGYCQPLATGSDAAFTPDPTLLTAVSPDGLVEFGTDGLTRRVLLSGAVSDPVWSSRGELAVVRGRWIWVGRPGKLRRLTRGSAPSWSPDGVRLVFVRRGWLLIGLVRGRSFRRLVRGTAPAWSPNGRWIAFFAKGHRLSVIPVGGGGVRRVGKVTGSTVDWQPLPANPPAPCLAPPGSAVIASGDTAILSQTEVGSVEGPANSGLAWAVMGCLRADGRERRLTVWEPTSPDNYVSARVTKAEVAGSYGALVVSQSNAKYGTADDEVEVFDLRTGCDLAPGASLCAPQRGGETSCHGCIDQLVLGADAVSAVHTTEVDNGCTCTVEQIEASDSTGVHTLDSVTEPDRSRPSLTNLSLAGDSLTWEHNGTPRSAQLSP